MNRKIRILHIVMVLSTTVFFFIAASIAAIFEPPVYKTPYINLVYLLPLAFGIMSIMTTIEMNKYLRDDKMFMRKNLIIIVLLVIILFSLARLVFILIRLNDFTKMDSKDIYELVIDKTNVEFEYDNGYVYKMKSRMTEYNNQTIENFIYYYPLNGENNIKFFKQATGDRWVLGTEMSKKYSAILANIQQLPKNTLVYCWPDTIGDNYSNRYTYDSHYLFIYDYNDAVLIIKGHRIIHESISP